MEPDAYITLVVIATALVLFVTERVPIDVVAIMVIVAFAVTGVLTPAEAVKGFANPATLTVAGMFVLSHALLRTGAINAVARLLSRLLERSPTASLAGMMTMVGGVSAFVNNTPVVATLIPVVSDAARHQDQRPSRLLIPLSYGAIFGGTCTLIGTSTNLLVSGIAANAGLEPFSMFLLTPFGLVIFSVGLTYMLFIGRRLVPDRPAGREPTGAEQIQDYLAEVTLREAPDKETDTIEEVFSDGDREIHVLEVERDGDSIKHPPKEYRLAKDDVLLVRGDMARIHQLLNRGFLRSSQSPEQVHFPEQGTQLLEIVILPNSSLVGRRLGAIEYFNKHDANVLAIRQRGREHLKGLKDVALQPGDILLLQTNQEGVELLREVEQTEPSPFLSMRQEPVRPLDRGKLSIVLATLASVVLLAATGLVPLMVGVLGGVAVLNLTGVITMPDAYKSIDWRVIFLLAGALSMGTALGASGVSGLVGTFVAGAIGERWGAVAVLSALYLATSICTEMMSNNAAAALIAPIALSVASAMGIDPLPLLLAVTFAGSASFMTPVGYQTNTMVYSAGRYRFTDFLKVGAPLNLLCWLLATLLLPLLYPF
ncbi:MAG: sodium:proton antiporter [Opitutales bacterium]